MKESIRRVILLFQAALFILTVIGTLISILPSALPGWFVNINFWGITIIELSIVVAILSFIGLVVVITIGMYLQLSGISRKIDTSLDEAFNRVDLQSNVRKVENFERELYDKVPRSRKIRNTFVGIRGLPGIGEEQHKLYNFYFDVRPQGEWIDIIGVGDVSSKRYKKIHGDHPVDIHVLRHSPPITNFILLEGDGGKTEVYFGWLSFPATGKKKNSAPPVKVFHSTSTELVQFFSEYFGILETSYQWGGVAGPHLEIAPGGGLQAVYQGNFIDKSGLWVTQMKLGSKKAPDYYAVLKIDFEYSKQTDVNEISVVIFDKDQNYITNASHGRALAHSGNELHFRWSQVEEGTPKEGFCTYIFEETNQGEVLGGHVITEGEYRIGRLHGRRIPDKYILEFDRYLQRVMAVKNCTFSDEEQLQLQNNLNKLISLGLLK